MTVQHFIFGLLFLIVLGIGALITAFYLLKSMAEMYREREWGWFVMTILGVIGVIAYVGWTATK